MLVCPCEGGKFLKKVSTRRLLQNCAAQENAAGWATYGLGLQDQHGALARTLIDLQTSQSVVDADICNNMHSGIDKQGEDVHVPAELPDPHSACCHELFGFCQKHSLHKVAQHFARHLSRKALDNHLGTGTLVRLQVVPNIDSAASASSTVPSSSTYFLGVMSQRPLLHVLLKAWPQPDNKFGLTSARGMSADCALPEFVTSYQVFRALVGLAPSEYDQNKLVIKVQVIQHGFERHFWSLPDLEVQASRVCAEFMLPALSEAVPKPSRDSADLPFGIREKPRKRKPRPKPAAGKGRGRAKGGGRARGRNMTQDVTSSSASDEGNTASESSYSADTSSSATSDDSDASASDVGSTTGEAVTLPTDTAMRESAAVAQAAREFKELQSTRAAIVGARAHAGSFFVKDVGFQTGSVAPTGRSSCFHCNAKICKGSVRFAYFWSRQRPSRYLHADCVPHFVNAAAGDRKPQAVEAMRNVVQSATEGSVKSGAERILSMLTGEAAASST